MLEVNSALFQCPKETATAVVELERGDDFGDSWLEFLWDLSLIFYYLEYGKR